MTYFPARHRRFGTSFVKAADDPQMLDVYEHAVDIHALEGIARMFFRRKRAERLFLRTRFFAIGVPRVCQALFPVAERSRESCRTDTR